MDCARQHRRIQGWKEAREARVDRQVGRVDVPMQVLPGQAPAQGLPHGRGRGCQGGQRQGACCCWWPCCGYDGIRHRGGGADDPLGRRRVSSLIPFLSRSPCPSLALPSPPLHVLLLRRGSAAHHHRLRRRSVCSHRCRPVWHQALVITDGARCRLPRRLRGLRAPIGRPRSCI